jgi:nucleoside triphosphatase
MTCISFAGKSLFWKKCHFLFFDYACRTDSTNVRLNDEAEDYIWVKPEKALDLPIDSYTRTSLLEYLKINSMKNDE